MTFLKKKQEVKTNNGAVAIGAAIGGTVLTAIGYLAGKNGLGEKALEIGKGFIKKSTNNEETIE